MPPIFKTSSGLPLAVYIEPSTANRAALVKAILSNGGAPRSRISDANVILIDTQSRDGRECARQICTDPNKVVLFHEWIEACLSAGKLLGDDLNWGNLRIDDPEFIDESLYVDDDASVAHVKEEETHAAPPERNGSRPWPTPTSPTRLPPGELPVSAGEPSRTAVTPPLVKPETIGAGPSQQHIAESPRQSPGPSHSKTLSSPRTKTKSPLPPYGQVPSDPELGSLFLSACKEWDTYKKETASYTSPALKRKARSMDRNSLPVDKPVPKSLETSTSNDQVEWSPSSAPIYEPLAKKQRPPLPPGSTKRGPKRRKPSEGIRPSQSDTSLDAITPSQSFDNIDHVDNSPTPKSSTPQPAGKLFTFMGEPIQFWLQVDLPDRGGVIRLLKKHGGQLAMTMEAASYVIVSKAAPQYAELVIEADAADRAAVPVAWINQCVKTGSLVPIDEYVVATPSGPTATLTEEDIIQAATADAPPAPSTSAPQPAIRGYRFTTEDQVYFQRYLAWKYARNPGFSISELCEELARGSNHSSRSWVRFYYRPISDVPRVMAIVKTLMT